LRKYGFSFITALLTAQAILIPATNQAGLPNTIKFGVMVITLFLILALAIFERSYQLVQESIAQRALVLEQNLNLELTETISHQYTSKKIRNYEFGVYAAFVLGTLMLAFFVLLPESSSAAIYQLMSWIIPKSILPLILLIILAGISIAILLLIKWMKPEEKPHWSGVDWDLDRVECKKGESVAITLTNLNENEIIIPANTLILEIRSQDGIKVVYSGKGAKKDIKVPQNHSYTWLWDTGEVDTGIYRVFPGKVSSDGTNLIQKTDKEVLYLRRRIRVYDEPNNGASKNLEENYSFVGTLKFME
ncbi:MAG TPA: hypothetical protein VF324_00905, partial [Methanobacterium sp.]